MSKRWSVWSTSTLLVSSLFLTGCQSSCPSCTSRQTPLLGTQAVTPSPRSYAVSPSQSSANGAMTNMPQTSGVPSTDGTMTRSTLPPNVSSSHSMPTAPQAVVPTSGSMPTTGMPPLPVPELPSPPTPPGSMSPSVPATMPSVPSAPVESGSMIPPQPSFSAPQP